MAGPWEKYATTSAPNANGPWAKYAQEGASSFSAPQPQEGEVGMAVAPELVQKLITQPSSMTREQRLRNAGKAELSDPTSIGRTALDQSSQGATFGFADEASNLLGALGAKAYDATVGQGVLQGRSVGNLYNEASQMSQDRMAQQFEQRPGLSIASNLVGSVATGGAALGTKAGKAVAQNLRSGEILGRNLGLAGRAAKSGLLGASSAGVSGFGAGSGLEDRLSSASQAAVIGGGLGALLPVAGEIAGQAAKKLTTPKAPIASADEVSAMANQAYKEAESLGGTLSSSLTDDFLNRVGSLKPKSVAGQTVPIDSKFREVVDFVEGLRGKSLSLQDAQTLDEYLGDAIDSFTEMGRVNKTGQKLLTMQRELRNVIETAGPEQISGGKGGFDALKEGRKLWAAQAKLRDIEKIITRAEMTDNPATAVKTGMRNLLLNAKKTRGYTDEELKLIKKAANTGVVSDLLRTAGSRLVPIAAGAAGGLGTTAAASAGSMAARGAATRMQMNRALNVAREISKRAAPQEAPKSTSQIPAILSSPSVGTAAVPIGQISGAMINGVEGQQPPQPLRLNVRPRSLLGN